MTEPYLSIDEMVEIWTPPGHSAKVSRGMKAITDDIIDRVAPRIRAAALREAAKHLDSKDFSAT